MLLREKEVRAPDSSPVLWIKLLLRNNNSINDLNISSIEWPNIVILIFKVKNTRQTLCFHLENSFTKVFKVPSDTDFVRPIIFVSTEGERNHTSPTACPLGWESPLLEHSLLSSPPGSPC